jgi:hypothetical protein
VEGAYRRPEYFKVGSHCSGDRKRVELFKCQPVYFENGAQTIFRHVCPSPTDASLCLINGFQIRMLGDTCGGACELTSEAFFIFWRVPQSKSALEFEAAYQLVLFFNCEFLKIFLGFFLSFEYVKNNFFQVIF